ncbi:MAG: T9SS type A sorting domain-containing protein [Cytophagales bacterium]|nr:T9SS type A sorting domain-containing protein [Cytophagales bacterium]
MKTKLFFLVVLSLIVSFNSFAQTTVTVRPINQQYWTGNVRNQGICPDYCKSNLGKIKAGEPDIALYEYRGWTKFDLSTISPPIPTNAVITDLTLIVFTTNASSNSGHELVACRMSIDPVTSTGTVIWNEIGSPQDYSLPSNAMTIANQYTNITLNQNARDNFKNATIMGSSWWAVGFYAINPNINTGKIQGWDCSGCPAPEPILEITYSIPVSITANFSSNTQTVSQGGSVNFYDNSTGNITSRNWTFYGGNPSSQTSTNPIIYYDTVNTYDVKLVVSDGLNYDTIIKANYITVTSTTTTQNTQTVGGLTVYADTINSNIASGNVSIAPAGCPNGILKFSGDITISGSNTINSSSAIYLQNVNSIDKYLYNLGIPYTIEVEVSGTTFTSNTSFFSWSKNAFEMAVLDVGIDNINIQCDQVTINGHLRLPTILSEVNNSNDTIEAPITGGVIVSHTGVNYNSLIYLNNIRIYKLLQLNYFSMDFNSSTNDYFCSTSISTPLIGIEAFGDISGGKLNSIGMDITCNNPSCLCCIPLLIDPITQTGLYLYHVLGSLENLADSTKPLEITFGAGVKIMGSRLGALGSFDLVGRYVDGTSMSMDGYLVLFGAGYGAGFTKWKHPQLDIRGEVNFLSGLVNAYTELSITRTTTNDLKLRGNFGASFGCPYPADVDKTWLKLVLSLSGCAGTVFATSENFLTNDYIAGYARVKFPSIPTLYYLLEGDSTGLQASFGKNFNIITYSEAQGALGGNLKTAIQSSVYSFALDSSTNALIIEASDSTGSAIPEYTIYLTNGDSVNAQNVNNFSYISYFVDSANNFSFYYIKNPKVGDYYINVINADTLNIYRANNPPFIKLENVTQNTGNKVLQISWIDSDPDGNAIISLGYDMDNYGANGVLFVDTLTEDTTIDEFTWNYVDINTGTYYIYAIIEDSIHQTFVSYWKEPITIVQNNGLNAPTGLDTVKTTDTSIVLSWNNSNPSPISFILYYSNDPNSVSYNSPSIGIGETNTFEFTNFTPGLYYEFMLTAMDIAFNESSPSNILQLTWISGTLNNAPYIPVQEFLTIINIDVDSIYNYQLIASDPDGSALTYTITQGSPVNMSIDSSGLITWIPADTQIAYNQIYIKVCDPSGLCDSVFYQVLVLNNNMAQANVGFNKTLFVDYDDDAMVFVNDPDFAGDNFEIDSIMVRAYSESDFTGIFPVIAYETTFDSKEFFTDFKFTSLNSSGDSLKVSKGDTIWAEYYDPSFDTVVKEYAYFTLFEASFTFNDTICSGDTMWFTNTSTGDAIITYSWDFDNDGTGDDPNQNPYHVFNAPHGTGVESFDVTLTIFDNVWDTTSATMTIHVVKQIDLGPDTGFCTSIELSISSPANEYLWSTGDTTPTTIVDSAGSHFITATDYYNCVSSDTINIYHYPIPEINLGTDTIACDNVLLDSQMPDASVLWSTGDTTSAITVISSGNYWVRIINNFDCINYDTINVTIASPVVELGPNASVCSGSVLDAGSGTNYQYIWSTGETTQTIIPNSTGVYYVTVTDANTGCSTTDTVNITILDNPVAWFSYSVNAFTVSFLNGSINNSTSFWSFGDGYTSTAANPVHTYQTNVKTFYIVQLIVTNNCSTDTLIDTITVSPTGIFEKVCENCLLRIYPNPTYDYFTIEYYTPGKNEIILNVYNPLGKLIHNEISANITGILKKKIDLTNNMSGIYVMFILDRNEKIIWKIVKMD